VDINLLAKMYTANSLLKGHVFSITSGSGKNWKPVLHPLKKVVSGEWQKNDPVSQN